MARIAFIGAGSFSFTRTLVRDILTFEGMRDATIALMDIDKPRLKNITRAVKQIVQRGDYPATVVTTTDRKEAIKGADAVIITILAGSTDVWQHDILIPKRYGVDTNIGDTRGPSGIFRALRTIPVMLDIARDVARYAPRAVMLNYTNPMAMLTKAMLTQTDANVTGLCHSVQGTARMLARWIKAPLDEITYTCAGINHLAWYTRFDWNGRDAYPLIRKAMKRPKVRNEEQVRNEMFLKLGYYVTESSGHNSEYNPWFRKRPDLIEKYCTHSTGWNPGEYAYILKEYRKQERNWKKTIQHWLDHPDELPLHRGLEYASRIINAWLGAEPFRFNGNVLNTGLVTNLPQGCCVEVPVLARRCDIQPMYVGALPPQCAALSSINAQVEDMAVEGALAGDPERVYHAICYDPLTSAVLSLDEIKKMTRAMFRKNRDYLPQFKTIDF